MTTVAFLDTRAGIAGDMCLGALVDAGLPEAFLKSVVERLGLEDVEVSAEKVQRGPLAATKVHVLVRGASPDPSPGHATPHAHAHAEHRTLAHLLDVVRCAKGIDDRAKADAVRTFEHLAVAEARVHGTTVDTVHFHEVGAADALVDIVGTCAGLRELGATEVRAGPLPWSTGEITTAHGRLPLPPPAVMCLLEGHPTFPSDEGREQVTPTGAALVKALCRGTSVPVGFVPRRVGHGAGTHQGRTLPNVVRVVFGEVGEDASPVDAVLLEANLDDVTGQEVARAIEEALAAGALDAWAVPVTMKKGRPGLVLSLLVGADDVARHEALLFRTTPTLGVRRHAVARTVLPRRHETVTTPWGTVRMKVRETPDGPAATPEYDDAALLAQRHDVPLVRVLEAARAAWHPEEPPPTVS